MFDYIVIGAGFAGCVISERIASNLQKKVLLIEKKNHIGGHCYDYKDQNNIIIHKYGPHLFHTDEKDVFEYLSNFTEWDYYQHKVLAYVDGVKIPLPFNFNSMEKLFSDESAKKLQRKLIEAYEFNSKVPILELKKNEDPDIQFLASYIYNKIFKNYTAKQWEMHPEELDKEVTSRVPIYVGRDDRYFNDKYQYVPKEGYSKIFQRMLKNNNIKLLLNTNFNEIINLDFETKKIFLLNNEFKGKMIFTGMIDELFNYKFGELPYRSLRLDFKTIDKEYHQENAVVNYPNNYDFTRITEFKHIHYNNSGKTTILYEYPEKYNKEKNDPYYPLFTTEAKETYNKYFEYSRDFNNIVFIGRLTEYKYYDMDDIVKRALDVFEERIK